MAEDPYAAFGEPIVAVKDEVTASGAYNRPSHEQAPQAVAPEPATQTAAPPANDPYSAIGDPHVTDVSGTSVNDPNDITPSKTLTPDQEAEYGQVIRNGSVHDILSKVEGFGFSVDPAKMAKFVHDRDAAIAKGGQVDFSPAYAPVTPVDTTAPEATARGVMDTVSVGTMPKMGALIAGTEAAMSGGDFDQAYHSMLDQNNAAIGSDEQNHGTARLIGQLVGGLAIPTGLEGVGIKAGTEALRGGASMAEARTIAARAVGQRMIATNTAYGVAHGAGSADTLGDAAKGALVEGTIGAVTGGVLAKAGETLAPKLAERALAARAAPMTPAQQLTQETQKFVAAADRQDIGFMAADLPNATKSRFATAVAGITLGGIPLADRATELIGQAKAARDAIAARLAGGVDNVTDKTGAGQAAQKGAREWMTTTEAKGQALEDALPIDAKAKVQLGESRAALRYLTTGMESNPELSKIWTENPRLKATLDALTPKEIMEPGKPAQKGGTGFGVDIEGTPAVPAKGTGKAEGGELEWKDMRRLRTIVGQIVGQPGLSSDGAAIDGLRNLYGALSRDMEATAAATSPRALTQFGRVNQFWRGRQSRIDNVLSDVLGSDGKKDPQKAFEAIQRLGNAQGGQPIKLAQTLRSMPTDEADSVRATIIGHLGDAAAGKQTKDGDVFSPATFATKWNGMSPRAKSILFQGQHAKDLDDIARVMDGMKAAGQFANVSKTSIATSAMATMGSGWLNPFVPVVASALQFGGGKLLANQTVARWIAGALKKPNPKAGFTAIQGLTKIARAEPAIANEVFSLQSRLASAFTLPPTSLAANEGDNHR